MTKKEREKDNNKRHEKVIRQNGVIWGFCFCFVFFSRRKKTGWWWNICCAAPPASHLRKTRTDITPL